VTKPVFEPLADSAALVNIQIGSGRRHDDVGKAL